jgi:hypothetical protein
MIKFRVSVHGRNYQIGIMKRVRFVRKELSTNSVGFFTTRFVEAESATEAIEIVFSALTTDLEQEGRTTHDSVLDLEGICEDDAGFDEYAPGNGYTFYSQDDETPTQP